MEFPEQIHNSIDGIMELWNYGIIWNDGNSGNCKNYTNCRNSEFSKPYSEEEHQDRGITLGLHYVIKQTLVASQAQ